jgi:riboflavin kinase, archaea type
MPRRASAKSSAPAVSGPELSVLKFLALSGGDRTPLVVTSAEVGEKIGLSQQAADRHLLALEKRGLVARKLGSRRQRLLLTPEGLDLLRAEHAAYRRIFEGPGKMRFRGTVASGLGEGRYYLSQPGYVVQFTERLGYSPYPGTLNVKVPPDDLTTVGSVRHWSGIRIDGFQASGRTFGGATCYPARLNGRACHLIVPDRTHHKDVVEFIAKEYLRDALRVKDTDPVDVVVEET